MGNSIFARGRGRSRIAESVGSSRDFEGHPKGGTESGLSGWIRQTAGQFCRQQAGRALIRSNSRKPGCEWYTHCKGWRERWSSSSFLPAPTILCITKRKSEERNTICNDRSFQVGPNLVDKSSAGFFLFAFPLCAPRADVQKAQHIHSVDLVEFPSGLHEGVIGGINVIWQRQNSGVCAGSVAAVVGKSDSTSVVWACTAISASAISCISRSTG